MCDTLGYRVIGARGIYSIGAVSRMVGVSQAAIRSWEDRYGLIVAERSGHLIPHTEPEVLIAALAELVRIVGR